MIRSRDFESISEIVINHGRMKVTMPNERVQSPSSRVCVYCREPLEKPFREMAEYCTNMRKMADRMYYTYMRIAEILQD